jgi:hypothetical protein
MSRIQSGIEYQTRPRGRPEEKESRTTDAVRHDRIARTRLPEVDATIEAPA